MTRQHSQNWIFPPKESGKILTLCAKCARICIMTNDEFTIKITKEGLKTISAALECYSRLGCNQFKYCLAHNPSFAKLGWEEQSEIEDHLRSDIDSRNFGIYSPEVKNFTKAYEIKKEIDQKIVLSEKPIMEGFSKQYDGALHDYDYLPKFYGEDGKAVKHEVSINIPKKYQHKLKKLAENKDWNGLWDYIDKHVPFNGVRGNAANVSEDFTKITISKPYRLSKQAG